LVKVVSCGAGGSPANFAACEIASAIRTGNVRKRTLSACFNARPIRMEIIVNGDRREVSDGLTVAALLEFLQMRPNRVAIERNREILPRAEWQAVQVQPNDSFEIVQFVGGGRF
jgi:sulfur carrier protein